MRQIKIKALLFSTLIMGLTSCLKEDPLNIDTSQGPKNMVEFANTGDNVSAAASAYPRFNMDLGTLAANQTITFPVNVSYSGADVAPQDITVTLEISAEGLATFNTQNNTTYVIPDASIFSLPTTVVIPKGQRQASIEVSVTNNASYDFGKRYAIPLKISSATIGTISRNFGFAVYSFGARNYLDGDYTMKIKTTGWAAYGIEDGIERTWPSKIGLATSGANSVTINNYYRSGDHLQPGYADGAAATAFGAATPLYIFDMATNKLLNVENTSADDGRGRGFKMNPAVTDSRYDPATKTIYASYFMVQTGRPDMQVDVVFTYTGPRP